MKQNSGNSVMSQGEAVRHQPHWTRPYLKAEMLYGLCMLLSILEDSNSGLLTRDDTFKRMKEVKFLGDLTGTHFFAVAVQRGLLINHEYLTKPLVPLTQLCNAGCKHLFEDDKSITNERIWKATEMASENLGLHMIAGELALCEAIRASKEKSPGNYAHHKDQDLLWVSTDSTNNDNIFTELRVGMEPIFHSESYDREYQCSSYQSWTRIQ
jgi:hypothetical protein